jgi:CubicO group peptidase (beta-lactamase class C family)
VPASTQPADSLAGIVDAAAIAKLKTLNLPGMTVAVAKKGTILYSQAYGYADVATCRPMQVTDSMQIGSITKQFTASAVLQLQEQGLIDLDHTVASYLPQYPFDPRITVRMLLNQTSGLPEYLDFVSLQQYALTGVPESTALQEMAKAVLLFEPGAYHYYSNTNYFILGSIIEAVSSQNYADYLGANVFPRAGLTHTSYLQPSDAASPYGSKVAGGELAGTILPPADYFSAGALWSNVLDLAFWDDAWLSGKVVTQASINLMQTPAPVIYFQSGPPSDYGMGWITHPTISGHPFIWHNGQTTSYTAFNGLLTDTGFSLTVLTNYAFDDSGAPFLSFGEQVVSTICNTSAAGGC